MTATMDAIKGFDFAGADDPDDLIGAPEADGGKPETLASAAAMLTGREVEGRGGVLAASAGWSSLPFWGPGAGAAAGREGSARRRR
ncbi:hypothetical protein [Actinomadura nitritigenes]|uniref:hypothetical protein n=1 Tax=Actinomadura nitritigenes TaxID=134602 RepID=UPI003D8F3636